MKVTRQWQRLVLWGAPALLVCFLLLNRPGFFADPRYLAALIVLEIVLVSLWHYRALYFPLTMLVFTWSGIDVAFKGPAQSARWVVLAVGTVFGAAIWIREKRQSLHALHLVALLCLPTAAVSAANSGDPRASLLKVASLMLLFLYASMGARAAIRGREVEFVQGLVRACEFILYFTVLAYAAGWPMWGNPNSLGAVMSVVVMPLLFWGYLIAPVPIERYRMTFALLLCSVLLYVALSRAAILAATISCIVLCVCLRRQRLLAQGIFLAVLLLALAAVAQPDHFDQFTANLTNNLLYKGGHAGEGVFGSRQGPWDSTVASLKQHPWFGTGFGTSDTGDEGGDQVASVSVLRGIHTRVGTNREHGSSYLALAEYVGIVGLLPFCILFFLLGRMIFRVCVWMRRTANAGHCAVPLSMILLAGFIHAFFEDWMVSVGYHLCVFFWVTAFLLDDLLPASLSKLAGAPVPHLRAAGAAQTVFVRSQ